MNANNMKADDLTAAPARWTAEVLLDGEPQVRYPVSFSPLEATPAPDSYLAFDYTGCGQADPGTFGRPAARVHALPSNFHAVNGSSSALITTIDISELIALVDCERVDGSKVVVVSKSARYCQYTTTALLIAADGARAFYRARHGTGMASFWKGLAKRRPGVEFVRGAEGCLPGGRGQAVGE